jgi:hypothetical protein
MTHGDGGKGDTQRPTDQNKFSTGYDLIWGKKKQDDAKAEDEEFERIAREQNEKTK